MSQFQAVVPALGAVSSLALAALVLAGHPRGRLQWSFAVGMAAFAAESFITLVLLTGAGSLGASLFWLRVQEIGRLLLPLPWVVFVASLAQREATPIAWRFPFLLGGLLALVGVVGVATQDFARLSVLPGPFEEARLEAAGRYAAVVNLIFTVGILAGLEACLRTSRGVTRYRIKYLVLGLGGVFLVRFYLQSQVILFQTIEGDHLKMAATTLVIGNLVMAVALARDRLQGVELAVSRSVVYRSVVVAVLGVYLFSVGVLGWLLNRLEIPEQTFWGSLVVFVSALALAATLLSESVRWRIKRFIVLNFYRSKYDYREQWMAVTKRMGSLLTLEELGLQLLEAITEAVGSVRAALYLADAGDEHYHCAAVVGTARPSAVVHADGALPRRLRAADGPVALENGLAAGVLGPELAPVFAEGTVAVPLNWRGGLTGFMLLGPERTASAWTPEDLQFMATMGEQAAGSIVTARLSERLARAREFEAFDRLTSFVIHDLKNSVSALSMLSRNALKHFDDPEFQRDTVRTLSRTVDRMKALLAKLTSPAESAALRFEPVDVAALIGEATDPLRADPRVRIRTDLAAVPPVLGDPDALLRVIQNLLTNAVEALDGTGTVTVSLEPDEGGCVVAVSDTGCGMSEEFLRKSLFAPFRSTKKGGWGIGLYQAKELIERHGGTIAVTSKQAEGTTFRVRLPARAPAPGLAGVARNGETPRKDIA